MLDGRLGVKVVEAEGSCDLTRTGSDGEVAVVKYGRRRRKVRYPVEACGVSTVPRLNDSAA